MEEEFDNDEDFEDSEEELNEDYLKFWNLKVLSKINFYNYFLEFKFFHFYLVYNN